MEELRSGPRCVHELVEVTGASQSLMSQHLRVLRAARLVITHRRGKEIVYELADAHVGHIVGDAISHARENAPPVTAPPASRPSRGGGVPRTTRGSRSRSPQPPQREGIR
ncbi:MAG TPA: metalloregulator ArsR/SmtB family transcription factor [Mycobacteriales bacterium]|nr:metalloregulator ArsR/SmtB family transcription factor [Mycobacteriales bacterium]